MKRGPEDGVILVNVLVALALGAALVTLMLTSQDGAIDRTRRALDGAQAEALALGAEASVLVALRRDMEEAPEADTLSESWALAAQQEVVLETGRFAVTIRDAQGGIDLNGVAGSLGGGLAQQEALRRLVSELDLPGSTADLLIDAARSGGPFRRIEQVEGLDVEARSALSPHLAFLDRPALVNLNTADPVVMAAVLSNTIAARRLADLREREGQVTPQDLSSLGLVPGALVGFRSDAWDVEVLAEVDGVTARLTSRLVRQRSPGVAEVVIASRRWGDPANADLPEIPAGP